MSAMLVALLLFLVAATVGVAALALIGADLSDLRVALSAPAVGSAVAVIPLFVLSLFGAPMQRAGPAPLIVLVLAALFAVGLRRPRLPAAAIPVIALCILDTVVLGWPMLRFGFHWIANANGDMAYYVLAAKSLVTHGLLSPVNMHALAHNHDYPSSAQSLHLAGLRPGTEITLAAVAATLRHQPLDIYMPMSLALNMCGISATGALTMQATRRKWAAAVAAALFVVSPMAGYGVLQQLTPQVWGMALVTALFAWLMRPEMHQRTSRMRPDLAVVAVLSTALFIVYFEIAASLIVAYLLYVALLAIRREANIRAIAVTWAVPIAVTIAVTNVWLPRAIGYLRQVVQFGTSHGFHGPPLFGYAVLPTAVPGAVGLRSLFASPQSPGMTAAIVAGSIILLGLLATCLMTLRKGAAAGVALLGDIIIFTLLARNGNQFGLFKLYMYAQPFVVSTVAVWLAGLKARKVLALAISVLAATSIAQAATLTGYVEKSNNPADLRNGSATDLIPRFRELLDQATSPVVTATDNYVLGPVEGMIAGSRPLYFFGRNFFAFPWKTRTLTVPTSSGAVRLSFDENPSATRVVRSGNCVVAFQTGSQLTLNRRSFPEGSPNLLPIRCSRTQDVLVFIPSSLGQPSTLPLNRRAVAFWQLESDPSFPGHTFSGFGQYALFQILGKMPKTLRLELDYTTSPIVGGPSLQKLPLANISGADRVAFPVVGSGSARVFSPPLKPTIIDGRPYVVLDMGRRGQFPSIPRPGLTGLWASSLPPDPRALTSYVRDVSLVSTSQYRHLNPPKALRSFPADLANKDLEYSGIYEDGWVGQDSYAILAGGSRSQLVVRALVLRRRGGQRLTLLENGRRLYSWPVKPGMVDLNLPLPASHGPRKVELQWEGVSRLPAPDHRSVAARLLFLGAALPPQRLSFPGGTTTPGLVQSGIYSDGWLAKDAYAVLAGGKAATLTLKALVPASEGGQHLDVRVNGHPVASKTVSPGELDLHVSVPASKTSRKIELLWAGTTKLKAPDTRHAAARLKQLDVSTT